MYILEDMCRFEVQIWLGPVICLRSLSRSNLLAEERERKRFQAGEVLHSEAALALDGQMSCKTRAHSGR